MGERRANGPARDTRRYFLMPAQNSPDPYRRNKTRYPGITFRDRADGTRRYAVHFQRRWVQVEGGEKEALAKQAELRRKQARGEVVVNSSVTFAEFSAEWLESKRKLRPWTRKNYEAALTNYLLPRFG